eukprot:365755-Chlamydomonas_euryale.AAC.4
MPAAMYATPAPRSDGAYPAPASAAASAYGPPAPLAPAPGELEREWLRSQLGRWDLQLSRERAMRDWLAPDFQRTVPGVGVGAATLPSSPRRVAAAVLAGSAAPSAVWRLVNGEWQQLCSDGSWAIAPLGGPMAAHAMPAPRPERGSLQQSAALPAARPDASSAQPRQHERGGAHGRRNRRGGASVQLRYDDDLSDQDASACSVRSSGSNGNGSGDLACATPAESRVKRSGRLRTGGGYRPAHRRDVDTERDSRSIADATLFATSTAAAVAAASAPVAAGIAIQVWHSLQASALLQPLLPLPPLPSTHPPGQQLETAEPVARAAADSGGGAVSAPRNEGLHYFSGPRGETYCCVGQTWFQLPSVGALSAPPPAAVHAATAGSPVKAAA